MNSDYRPLKSCCGLCSVVVRAPYQESILSVLSNFAEYFAGGSVIHTGTTFQECQMFRSDPPPNSASMERGEKKCVWYLRKPTKAVIAALSVQRAGLGIKAGM